MNRYKHKIPKDDLKRFAKEIAKKLVASDYKAGRVKNPTKIDERQQKKVKEFCKEFFEKAYQKHKKHEQGKGSRGVKAKPDVPAGNSGPSPGLSPVAVDDDAEDVKMSEDEVDREPSDSPSDRNGTLKRKRIEEQAAEPADSPVNGGDEDVTASPAKRLNVAMEGNTPPPPPPPPAPPIETPPASTPREDDGDDDVDMSVCDNHTNIHADTNFRAKSMADVLAEAQQEGVDENMVDMEVGMEQDDSNHVQQQGTDQE